MTRPKLRFPTCPVYQNMTFPHISYTYLTEDRANLCKQMIQKYKNFALSYRFPTCMKSKFLSSGRVKEGEREREKEIEDSEKTL